MSSATARTDLPHVVVRSSTSTRNVATTATAKATICGIDRKNGPKMTYCPLNTEFAVRVSAPKMICAIICNTSAQPMAASNCWSVAWPTKCLNTS